MFCIRALYSSSYFPKNTRPAHNLGSVQFNSVFPGGSDGRASCLQCGRPRFDPWVGKISWRRKRQPTPVLLPGKFHGLRSLVGYSPWGPKESDRTQRLHFHFLSEVPQMVGIPAFLFPVSYSWAVCLTTLSLEFLIYKIGKVIPHAVIVRLK